MWTRNYFLILPSESAFEKKVRTKKKKVMVINNKYQIGQKVFFLDNGKAKCDEVKNITFFVYKDSVSIMYGFQKDSLNKYESEVFATENALKESVFGELKK